MKIAFFVQYCHEAGTYFRWQGMAKALLALGHTVDVYAGDFNYKAKRRFETRDGINYFIVPSLYTARIFGNPSDPFTAIYRLFLSPSNKYDVYHLFQPFLQAFLPWRFLSLKFKSATFVYDWDDLWIDGIFQKPNTWRSKYEHAIVKYLECNIPRFADLTTVTSHFLLNRFIEQNKFVKIYNGFSFHRVSKKNIPFLNRQGDDFYLGYIGRTAGELDWILSAATILNRTKPNFRIVLAGLPTQQLQREAVSSFKNIIVFDDLGPEDAKCLMAELDLALLPLSDNDFNKSRFPIKFFDYICSNTPVFYSRVGELEQFSLEIPGLYPSSGNKEEWVSDLIELMDKREENTLIKPSIDPWFMSFQWQKIGETLVQEYKIAN